MRLERHLRRKCHCAHTRAHRCTHTHRCNNTEKRDEGHRIKSYLCEVRLRVCVQCWRFQRKQREDAVRKKGRREKWRSEKVDRERIRVEK